MSEVIGWAMIAAVFVALFVGMCQSMSKKEAALIFLAGGFVILWVKLAGWLIGGGQ
jgi:hypothetical protein